MHLAENALFKKEVVPVRQVVGGNSHHHHVGKAQLRIRGMGLCATHMKLFELPFGLYIFSRLTGITRNRGQIDPLKS